MAIESGGGARRAADEHAPRGSSWSIDDAVVQGWMFPSDAGTLRTSNTMDRAWTKCLDAAKVKHRFTVHGLRYTFTDLIRLSKADAVVRRAPTGHVTQEMQQHYSNVGTDEKRAAIAGALRLLADTKATAQNQPPAHEPAGVNSGVNRGGSEEVMVS